MEKPKVDIEKFVHGTIALWVGDLERAKELIEDFLRNSEKISDLFSKQGKPELIKILKRSKKDEIKLSNNRSYSNNNDIFIYGPLFIRAFNIHDKILSLLSERDRISEGEKVRTSEKMKFGYLVTKVGINNFEIRGYSLYPPIEIDLKKFDKIKNEVIYSDREHVKVVDSAETGSIHSLTLEIVNYDPFVYAQIHIIKEGVIYGEAYSFDKETVYNLSSDLFEALEKASSSSSG